MCRATEAHTHTSCYSEKDKHVHHKTDMDFSNPSFSGKKQLRGICSSPLKMPVACQWNPIIQKDGKETMSEVPCLKLMKQCYKFISRL